MNDKMKLVITDLDRDLDDPKNCEVIQAGIPYTVPANKRVWSITVYESLKECRVNIAKENRK
jgi:hypothetical protein